jgi:hypothetical protein
VDFFEEVVRGFGLPPSVGEIYGLLYGSPKPLSFTDIVEQLKISKGSASQGLQFLRSLGAINVVGKRPYALLLIPNPDVLDAPRREYFEPELSLRKLVSGVLQKRVTPLAVAGAGRLARLRELAERGGEESVFFLDRVEQLETWQRRLKTILPMLGVLLGPKAKK